MKWITIQQYVDLETGEVINKETVTKEYRIIKSSKKTYIHEFKIEGQKHRVGRIERLYECRRNEFKQNTIW